MINLHQFAKKQQNGKQKQKQKSQLSQQIQLKSNKSELGLQTLMYFHNQDSFISKISHNPMIHNSFLHQSDRQIDSLKQQIQEMRRKRQELQEKWNNKITFKQTHSESNFMASEISQNQSEIFDKSVDQSKYSTEDDPFISQLRESILVSKLNKFMNNLIRYSFKITIKQINRYNQLKEFKQRLEFKTKSMLLSLWKEYVEENCQRAKILQAIRERIKKSRMKRNDCAQTCQK